MSDRVIRMRDRALNQMLYIKQFSESINENTAVEDIKVRLETLESRYQTVNELENQLCEDPKYEPITNETDDIYYTAHALLTKAASTHGGVKDNQELNTTLGQFIDQQRTFYEGVNTSQHVRLPKIQIEQFSGDYKHWASFHDLYKTTVHDNHNITEVHKLQILKGLLSGEAAALIRHIPVTQNNYSEAWDKICSRYNKLIPIVSSLIQSFFDQKPCSQTNGKELRRVTEAADEIIRGLRAVGSNAEERDPWLIHILLTKVDSESKQMWAHESVGNNFPRFEKFLEFLNRRCDALEVCDITKKITSRPTVKTLISNTNSPPQCLACNESHPLFKCPIFKNDDIETRIKFINKNNLCHNCLKGGHLSTKCYSKFTCMICQCRHHTLLHSSQSLPAAQQKPVKTSSHHTLLHSSQSLPEAQRKPDKTSSHRATLSGSSSSQTMPDTYSREVTEPEKTSNVLHSFHSSPSTVLPTAIVYVETSTGERQLIRALLDSGSQTSLVTESCAQRLGLKRTSSSISIHGLASSSAGKTRGETDMTIHSRIDNQYQLAVKAHIIGNITNMLPKEPIHVKHKITGLNLADPQFFKPSQIDILLGADIFFQILNPEKRTINGFPILQSSKFGWLVAGTYKNQNNEVSSFNGHHITKIDIQPNDELHQLSTKFWEVENVGHHIGQNSMSRLPEQYVEDTITKDSSGRSIVRLPLKENSRYPLGSSFQAAQQRLLEMALKFKRPEKRIKNTNHTSMITPAEMMGTGVLRVRGRLKESSSCINSRIVYIRHRCHKSYDVMGDLPAQQCTQSQPFFKVGLDYLAPLHIKTRKRRNTPADKAYVVVVICLAVKAVYLNVASGLDTSFLVALKRFISRRGIIEQMWCDNRAKFIVANRDLKEFKHQIIFQTNNRITSDFLLQKGIHFYFEPLHASHFGRLWETCVITNKYLSKRVTNPYFTFEEMTTTTIQIKSLFNSRPLCEINDYPANVEILTPAHFLIGEALTVIPEPGLAEVPSNKLSKWQNIQQRLQGFWNRWHRYYLVSLQQRNKWKSNAEQVKIDDISLLTEDYMYPSQWVLARITSVHAGMIESSQSQHSKLLKNEVKLYLPSNQLNY